MEKWLLDGIFGATPPSIPAPTILSDIPYYTPTGSSDNSQSAQMTTVSTIPPDTLHTTDNFGSMVPAAGIAVDNAGVLPSNQNDDPLRHFLSTSGEVGLLSGYGDDDDDDEGRASKKLRLPFPDR